MAKYLYWIINRDLCITYPEGMITALGNTALKTGLICSFTSVTPIKKDTLYPKWGAHWLRYLAVFCLVLPLLATWCRGL